MPKAHPDGIGLDRRHDDPWFFIPYLGAFMGILLSLALSFYYYTAQFWLYSIYDQDHRVLCEVSQHYFHFPGPDFVFYHPQS